MTAFSGNALLNRSKRCYSSTRENTFLRNRQQPVSNQGNAEGRRELAFSIFGGRSCRRDPFFPQSSRRRSSQPMQTRPSSATIFCDSSNPSGRRRSSPKTSITAFHAASGTLLTVIGRLFYETWFASDCDRLRFFEHTLRWPCWGDPEFTFCDVERAIQQEILKRNYLARYELRAAEAVRSGEMEMLKRLEEKYRTVASHLPDADSAPAIPSSAAQEVAKTRMPVQASLF